MCGPQSQSRPFRIEKRLLPSPEIQRRFLCCPALNLITIPTGYPISCGVKIWSLSTHKGHALPTFHRLQLSKTRGKKKKIIEGKQLLSTLTPTMAFITTKWANKTIAHYSNTNIPWGETLEK